MCAYNRVNQSYSCQNSKLLNGVLKDELGFQGYVMSDWGATHSGVAGAEAGLDMDMPGTICFFVANQSYFGGNLTAAVNNGSLPEERLDDMARRVMTPYFHLRQNTDYPPIDPEESALNVLQLQPVSKAYNYGPANVDVQDNHTQLIRELGAAGAVLLKNINNTLPLRAPKNIGVFGNDAGEPTDGLYFVSLGNSPTGYEFGTLPVGGGSGTGHFTYVVTPLQAIQARASREGALVQYVLNNTLVTIPGRLAGIAPAPPRDVCLVFLKTWATEGLDRFSLFADWSSTAVVESVAAFCNNTVVVTHNSGIKVMPWADNPNVTADIAAHFPGQESGSAIVDVLYGDVNPSGKLPYTIAFSQSGYSFAPIANSTALLRTKDPNAWQSDFAERLLIDYRHFDYYNISVQFEFGFGLSYANFSMSNLSVSIVDSGGAIRPVEPGGNPTLYDVLFRAEAVVSNTGAVAGATVAQLYLSLPQVSGGQTPTPLRVLRGFDKVSLQPGRSATLMFDIMRRPEHGPNISYWNTEQQEWAQVSKTIEEDTLVYTALLVVMA
ncbi:beta-glucosidase [Coniochaeta sp. 2T2.1]|nr:beta-glucosidase [Coniochaeta sp. 2T2.1]